MMTTTPAQTTAQTASPHTAQSAAVGRTRREPVRKPSVDIYESEKAFLVVADLPGVTPEALDVKFERGELAVVGGTFERTFAIPDTVDVSKIDAKLDAGVLWLTLPKMESAKPLHIAVRGA